MVAAFPEDLRDEPTLKNFNSVEGLAKSYVNIRKMQPQDMLARPKTDEDWGKLYDELGRPESADTYEVQRPEMPESVPYDEDSEKFFRALAHENGLSQKQFSNIYDAEIKRRMGMIEAGTSAYKTYTSERDIRLAKEFGDALEFHKSSAAVAVKEFASDEDAESILGEKLANGMHVGVNNA